MRFLLLVIFCAISITASAQFWQKKEKERYPLLTEAKYVSGTSISPAIKKFTPNVYAYVLPQKPYSLDIAEDILLREAKHHMRFRQYSIASNDFSTLGKLYVVAKRFSEAKWYLLQSNTIAKRENNDKLTITNLLDLAVIKAAMGELTLARTDLKEAHDLAESRGMAADLLEVDKLAQNIELKNSSASFAKAEFKYSAAVEAEKAAKLKVQ